MPATKRYDMKYLIIGLGIYGENLARDLTDMGHEVIGVDVRRASIEAVKDYISTVYVLDSTDESSLSVLPLTNVDLVIVAIGENFGASIKTVALLKKAGVEHIYARAIDKLHESILQSFDLDRIITPEQRAASDLSHEMELGTRIETLSIDEDNAVVKFMAPRYFEGMPYASLNLDEEYGLKLVAATRSVTRRNVLGLSRPVYELLDVWSGDEVVERGDVLAVFGERKRFHELYRRVVSD